MENEKYLNDISEIKNMMNQSSRFISLSGLSGVLAGIYSLIGAWLAYKTIYFDTTSMGNYKNLIITQEAINKLFIIAFSVLILSIITGIALSVKKAKKTEDKTGMFHQKD
jgi:predicted lysophospholipase L1 biosynthesis ABC-type transport system permease subunit